MNALLDSRATAPAPQLKPRDTLRRNFIPLLFALVVVLGSALYVFRSEKVPAGFHIDESSIAYNAYTISQTGRDEHDTRWPLFFRAFGDYKNPVYIYLLALIFTVTGPSIFVARLLSALCGITTVLLLGLLASRVVKVENKPECAMSVALLLMTTAFLTPWLFEISRVTLEVALFPVTIVLFLLSVQRSSTRTSWGWSDVLFLSSTLALITYTYSIGRMLAPLLAFGLLIFAKRERIAGIVRTWAVYLASLMPLMSFQRTNNGALTDRFHVITYIQPGTSLAQNVWQFIKHYGANLDPRRMFWNGDPNIFQLAHVYGEPALLIVTLLLLVAGLWLILRQHRSDAWWRFMVYGTIVSVVPAALTDDYFHILRLAGVLVFLLILTVPALLWIFGQNRLRQTAMVTVVVMLTMLQGLYFQYNYHRSVNDPWRRHVLEADYDEKIFKVALAKKLRPIYLVDSMSTPYIQAFWYGTIHGVPHSDFVQLGSQQIPPAGGLVISSEDRCSPADVVAQLDQYSVYVAGESLRPRSPLAEDGFRAEITAPTEALRFERGQRIVIPVQVKNVSKQVWPGCKREAASHQIYLASHWLDAAGKWSKEEGRTPLSGDLGPGQSATLKFQLTSPVNSGEYVIELDMLQEDVAWFGLKGSQTQKVRILVE